MARENGPGPDGSAAKRVSPDRGFYTDPGGQAGIRYWDGQEWSPLLPAGFAGGRQVGKFPGPVLSPLPEPDGSWQYAASQARRLKASSAGFAAAAAVTAAAAVAVHLGWLILAGLFALRAFNAWRARKVFLKLDQASKGLLLPETGEREPDAATRARRAGIVFAAWLVVTAAAAAVTVALYARDLSKLHADFTLALLALIASGFALIATYSAWQRFNGLGRTDQTGLSVAGLADSESSTSSPPGAAAAGGQSRGRGGGDIQEAAATIAEAAGLVPGGAHTPAGPGDAGSGPPMTVGDTDAPAWAVGTPLAPEATGGFPLPADVTGGEPSPRRRRIVPLTAAAVTLVAAMAVTAIVLGKTSAHTPAATQAPTPAAARTPVTRELTIGQLRAGDCLQGPPDINTARSWPEIATAVPCSDKHLSEVYFFSADYWPAAMAFPGHATIAHQARMECRKVFQAYDGAPLPASELSFHYTSPWNRADWDSGGRLLLCTAYVWDSQYPQGVPLYSSIKGSYS
jgi:hypothetical protein